MVDTVTSPIPEQRHVPADPVEAGRDRPVSGTEMPLSIGGVEQRHRTDWIGPRRNLVGIAHPVTI